MPKAQPLQDRPSLGTQKCSGWSWAAYGSQEAWSYRLGSSSILGAFGSPPVTSSPPVGTGCGAWLLAQAGGIKGSGVGIRVVKALGACPSIDI